MKRYLTLAIFALVLLATSGDPRREAGSGVHLHLWRAARYLANQDYSKAETEYRNALRISPQDPVAIRQLGIIYADQGKLAKSYEYLQKAARREPHDDTVQLKLAETFLAIGANSEARRTVMGILNRQPENNEALLLLADAARSPHEVDDARRLIRELQQNTGDRATYHAVLGMFDVRQQHQNDAESEFKEALKLDPQSHVAQFGLGNLYWLRHEIGKADQFFAAAVHASPLRSAWRLRYAEFKRETGAPGLAEKLLQELTDRAPDFLPGWIALMDDACAARKVKNCVELSERILKADPTNYPALLAQADLKLAEGKTLQALIELDRMRRIYDRLPDLHYRIALVDLATGNVAEALRSLSQAIALAPDFDDAVLLRDDLYIARGDTGSAVSSLSHVVKERPNQAAAHLLLARAYLVQKRSDQALDVYQKMRELFPNDPRPNFLIGMQLARQNREEDARSAFEQALRADPTYIPALTQIVRLDLRKGNYPAAATRVQQEIANHPQNAELLCLEAEVEISQRHYPEAEAIALKAVELNKNLETAHVLLATARIGQHRYQDALQDLLSFSTRTFSIAALMQIGMIQTELKQFKAAADTYERLLARAPNFVPALNNIASIKSENLGQLDAAKNFAERARAIGPDDPYNADTLGWVYVKKGLYNTALPLLEQAARGLPDEPEVQFHLGVTLDKIGRKDTAVAALQRAARSPKGFPDRAEALQHLNRMTNGPSTIN